MTDVQLIPIGTSPAWHNAGEPCSGFLLETEGFRVLVDCGTGVISRYLALYGAEAPIDAVVLSHVHPDHCFDLVPLKYGIDLGTLHRWKPQLWMPPGARERLTRLTSAWDADFSFFTETFDVREYEGGTTFDAGPFTVRTCEVPHFIESYALRFEAGGASVGFSSDLGPNDLVAPFMRSVDLLLAEAACPEGQDVGEGRGHISATEAGRIASDAGAHSLLLTHVPEQNGFDRAVAAASAVFDGPVSLARSGQVYDVRARLAAAG